MIEGKPQSKSCNWGQWQLEPSSFSRTEEEEFSHWLHVAWRIPLPCLQSRHLELCLAAHELPALHSHLLYGCWQHKPTFFLTTSPEPLCDAGPMSRNQSAPRLQFFFPPQPFTGAPSGSPGRRRILGVSQPVCLGSSEGSFPFSLFQQKGFRASKLRSVIVQLVQTVTAHHNPRTPVRWG